ncbi:MAG: helix-turn-helix domain-containing protein [Clostridia bacterium]
MYEWQKQIQIIVDEIDACIENHEDETLTLGALGRKLGYSEFHTTRKFKEITGLSFRDYLRRRKLAFALKEVRDSSKSLLEIAVDYGFSSHEAFTRSFKEIYGTTPAAYRKEPKPVILRTKIHPFDRYFFGMEEIGMVKSDERVKIYFITIPAHKFLHISNKESNGYWDFWQKQNQIPGQDYETVCGLLDSIKGKLDDVGGSEANCGSGQIMAYINDPTGRLCDWGIPRTECWGVRLPPDYAGEVPSQMRLAEIPEGEYIVFEHGPFDYEQENRSVERRIEKTMVDFDYRETEYSLDTSPGRIMYFYFNPERYFKYIRPVQRTKEKSVR